VPDGGHQEGALAAPLNLFPQLLELVVPHVLILEEVHGRVPAHSSPIHKTPTNQVAWGAGGVLRRTARAHSSSSCLTVPISPPRHSRVFLFVFERVTTAAGAVFGTKPNGGRRGGVKWL